MRWYSNTGIRPSSFATGVACARVWLGSATLDDDVAGDRGGWLPDEAGETVRESARENATVPAATNAATHPNRTNRGDIDAIVGWECRRVRSKDDKSNRTQHAIAVAHSARLMICTPAQLSVT